MLKEFLKDYGTLFGPLIAFILGVIAIYIKFYLDRKLDIWRSKKKLKKLIEIVLESKPPSKYYPQKGKSFSLHADEARNLRNLAVFNNRLAVINSFISAVENDILTNCTVIQIQQFQKLKIISSYLTNDVVRVTKYDDNKVLLQPEFNQGDFRNLTESYNRLLRVCKNPKSDFNYIEC